jgi:hypothetical protein
MSDYLILAGGVCLVLLFIIIIIGYIFVAYIMSQMHDIGGTPVLNIQTNLSPQKDQDVAITSPSQNVTTTTGKAPTGGW